MYNVKIKMQSNREINGLLIASLKYLYLVYVYELYFLH